MSTSRTSATSATTGTTQLDSSATSCTVDESRTSRLGSTLGSSATRRSSDSSDSSSSSSGSHSGERKNKRDKSRRRIGAHIQDSSTVESTSGDAVRHAHYRRGGIDGTTDDCTSVDEDSDAAAGANVANIDPRTFLHKPLWTTRPSEAVSIFWNKGGSDEDPNTLAPSTVVRELRRTKKHLGMDVALRNKNRDLVWEEVSWRQWWEMSKKVARSLIKSGVRFGRRVGIMAANSEKWAAAFMGANMVGGIPVGIADEASSTVLGQIFEVTELVVLFVQNADMVELVLRTIDRIEYTRLLTVISFAPMPDEFIRLLRGRNIYGFSWTDYLLLAGTEESQLQRLVRRRSNRVQPGGCAAIVMTAGGSGPAKPVMLSHDNIVWTATVLAGMVGARSTDRVVSYIPFCSVYGLVHEMGVALVSGACLSFAAKTAMRGSLGDILREVQPSFFIGLPYFLDRIRRKFEYVDLTTDTTALRSSVLRWSQRIGLESARRRQAGQAMPWGHWLAKVSTFSPFLNKVGLANARIVLSVGGPLELHTQIFFQSLGISIYETYGAAETSGVATLSLPRACAMGSAGRRLLGTGVTTLEDRSGSIDETGLPIEQDDGEGVLWAYGRNVFMGYLHGDKAELASLFDTAGWFRTDDVARFDSGYVFVDGPHSSLFSLASGVTVVPYRIETRLVEHIRGIEHAFVYGADKPYLVALFTAPLRLNRDTGAPTTHLENGPLSVLAARARVAIDTEAAAARAAAGESSASDDEHIAAAELLRLPAMMDWIAERVEAFNDDSPEDMQIGRWAMLPTSFSCYGGELDSTHKVRRYVVEAKYAETIAMLYE